MADLELGISVPGVDDAVRDLQKVKDAQQAVSSAAAASGRATTAAGTQASGALRNTGAAAQTAGQSVGQMAQRIQGAAAAAAQLGNAFGGSGTGRAASLVSSLAGATAQTAALGAAMGPLGVAIGAVGLATTVAGVAFARQRESMASTQQIVDRLTRSYGDLVSEIESAATATQRMDRVRAGQGSIAEQRAFSQQALNRQALITRALRGDASAIRALRTQGVTGVAAGEEGENRPLEAGEIRLLGSLGDRAAREARERMALEPAAATRDVAAAERSLETRAGRVAERGRSSGGESDEDAIAREWAAAIERRRQYEAEMAALYDAAKAREERLLEIEREVGAEKRELAIEDRRLQVEAAEHAAELRRQHEQQAIEYSRQQHQHQQELAERGEEAAARFRNGWTTSLDDVAERWREANVELKNAGLTQISHARLMERSMIAVGNNIAEVVGGTMVSAFKSAVTAWVDGSKTFVEAAEDMVKGVIQALVIEAIVQGTVEIARGIADIASYQYATGAQHFAAAAAWAAVGGVAGAVGGAIGAFGGGGSKGDAGATDRRDLTDRSLGEGSSDRPIIVIVQPGWANAREQQRFVFGTVADGARSGMRIDETALRGRR